MKYRRIETAHFIDVKPLGGGREALNVFDEAQGFVVTREGDTVSITKAGATERVELPWSSVKAAWPTLPATAVAHGKK